MDVGCHVLDRIDYLCGPLVDIKGEAQNKNSPHQKVEDYVHLTASIGATNDRSSMQHSINAVGAKVECTWDFASPDQEPSDQLVLEGPSGSLRMTGMSPNAPIEVYDSDGNLLRKIAEFAMPEHTAQALIQAVTLDLVHLRLVQQAAQQAGTNVDAYEKPDFLSFGENAIRTQKVIDEVLESYYSGREIGYWSRWNGDGK
jgi:predicted dehydrogenase